MLDLMAVKEGKPHGHHSQDAREFVDDLLSQVTKMEFFGTKTAPCKYPGDSNLNSKFYTIPVKLMFRDRKAAQTASELLREHMGINSTTPYHKSLRAAMNMAIAKTKEANPGHHAKVNLDLNGKTLKCFIRTDTKPPGKWIPAGKNIPLPQESMDPSTKDISNIALPTSPFETSPWWRRKQPAVDSRATFQLNITGKNTGSGTVDDETMDLEAGSPVLGTEKRLDDSLKRPEDGQHLPPQPNISGSGNNDSTNPFKPGSSSVTRTPPAQLQSKGSSLGS